MVWSGFAIALFLVFVFQTGVVSTLGLTQVDLFLVLALLCGMMAPLHDARLAAWFTGLGQDLGSADPLGIHAFVLGLTGVLLTQFRELGNITVWWVRGLVAFLAAWPGQLLYRTFLRYWAGFGDETFPRMVAAASVTSAIAAALAMCITFLPYYSRRRQRLYSSY